MKNRKRNRLKGFDYSQNNLYFVTFCVKNNLCCLGNVKSDEGTGRDLSLHHPEINHPERTGHDLSVHHSEINHSEINHSEISYFVELNKFGLVVENQIKWLMIQYEYVVIHNYVVMPNHIHILLEIDSLRVQDVKIKSLSSLIGALKTTSSKLIHEREFIDFAWHRSFHDNIVRNQKAYRNISNYIDLNPQKWFQDKFYSKV